MFIRRGYSTPSGLAVNSDPPACQDCPSCIKPVRAGWGQPVPTRVERDCGDRLSPPHSAFRPELDAALQDCQFFAPRLFLPAMDRSMKKIKIAQFGLGPIGLETLKLAATRHWLEIVGGVDIDPAKAGRDLGALTGVRSLKRRVVYNSLGDLVAHAKPDVILHTAVSRFRSAFEHLESMARAGISVVSSCEEMVFPQLREPRLAARLDRACREGGARMVGTGVNPGFVMDILPLCLTGVSCSVTAVHVRRVVNASTRRAPLQRKIGSGLPPAEFRRRLKAGLAGHAGLKESLALLARGLGWHLVKISETGHAMVADHDIRTEHLEVRTGQTCGLHQRVEAVAKGKGKLTLDLKMYLDAPDPQDAVQIDGVPPLNLTIPGGVAGDPATAGALINTIPRLLAAKPGLVLLMDLPLPHYS